MQTIDQLIAERKEATKYYLKLLDYYYGRKRDPEKREAWRLGCDLCWAENWITELSTKINNLEER
jgi:hypothetical protein